jgi:HlyD family secretion protein
MTALEIGRWKFRRRLGVGLGVCVATVIAAVAALGYPHSSPPKSPARDVSESPEAPMRISSLGRLEPKGRIIQVTAPSGNESARVEHLYVAEGDDVRAGQLLARMDPHKRRLAEVAEAEAKLAAAKGRLDQIKAGARAGDIGARLEEVQLLATQLKVAQRELDRAELLRGRSVISVEEFDAKKWQIDRLTIEHRRAEQLLASVREVRDIDVRVQELEVAAAVAAVERARSNLEASDVFAPSAGRILKIHTRPGEKIGERGLLEMGDVANMQAVAEVFEGDVGDVRVGQQAEVRLAGDAKVYVGVVSTAGHLVARKVVLTNDPVSDTDARVVEVRIDLRPADAAALSQLANARVEVLIEVDGVSRKSRKSLQPAPDQGTTVQQAQRRGS